MVFFGRSSNTLFIPATKKTIKDRYLEKLRGIIDGYRNGTEYNIHMMDNGLIWGGRKDVALTWMDAITPDGPVTPRIGSPVEIQALWYNALSFFHELSGEEEFAVLAAQVSDSFDREFWSWDYGYLADVVDGEEKDWSIRPNMLFATSLPYTMLSEEKK